MCEIEKWREMSDNQLTIALRKIIERSSSAEEASDLAKEELGYPYRISVSWGKTSYFGGFPITPFMGMAHNKDGKTLHL